MFRCLCYLSVTELSHFHLRQTTTLRFLYNTGVEPITYSVQRNCSTIELIMHLTVMCVVCRFIPFWDTICDTPHVFLLRILHRFSRLCSGYPAHFLSIYIRAFDCGLTPVSLACVLFVAVPLKESTVLGGTVSRQLTVLPSVIICRSSVGYTSTFWMKVTDIASCLIVLLAKARIR